MKLKKGNEINMASTFCKKCKIHLPIYFHSTLCICFISLILNSNTYFTNDEIERNKNW